MTTTKQPILPKYLKHYTSLKSLYSILNTCTLNFGNPEKWDDQNDVAGIRAFCRLKSKERAKQLKVGVLCFAKGSELIHHWNSYAEQGCCISFDENEVFKEILCKPEYIHNIVKYKADNELTTAFLKEQGTDKIPFLKRIPYQCEREYRVIWFGTGKFPKLHFKKTAIGRVLLSPEIKNREQIQKELTKKYGIKTELSRIIGSDPWISKFNNLCKEEN